MAAVYVIAPELKELLDNSFSYHLPFSDQGTRYSEIREAGRQMAILLYERCPPSAELTLARRAIEDAVMRANQAIALNEHDV